MHMGIVHKYPNGQWLWADNVFPKDFTIPRCPSLNNQHMYFTSETTELDFSEILGPDDIVFGPTPGKILGIKIRTRASENRKPGSYTIYNPKIWQFSSKDSRYPSILDQRLIEKYAFFAMNNAPAIRTSLASTAMSWYMTRYDGREVDGKHYPSMSSLAPRWRALAQSSLHGGPISCLRGGSKMAWEIDIKGAFLGHLTKPVPIVTRDQQYIYEQGASWEDLKGDDRMGFVEATVWVPRKWKKGLPPLPFDTEFHKKFPVGRFRGAWPIHLLRFAEEEYDVKIECVHQHMYTRRFDDTFGALAQEWANTNKDVSKPLYTRFWGKFGFRGGFTGYLNQNIEMEASIPHTGFWWADDRIDESSDVMGNTYRPDISATIAAYNHIAVHKALKLLDPKSIIAVHVDAIWTDDEEGVKKILDIPGCNVTNTGTWHVKHEGPLRFWAPGVYDHNGKIGCSGFPIAYEKPNRKKIEKWIQNEQKVWRPDSRKWKNGLNSAYSVDAISRAPQLEQNITRPITEGPLITDPMFTTLGHRRRHTN